MATRNRQYKLVPFNSVGNRLPACNFRQHSKRSKCKIRHSGTLHGFVTATSFVSKNEQTNYSHPSALFLTMKDTAWLLLCYGKVINKNNLTPNPFLKMMGSAMQNFTHSHHPELCPVQDLDSQRWGEKLSGQGAGHLAVILVLRVHSGTHLLFGTTGVVL